MNKRNITPNETGTPNTPGHTFYDISSVKRLAKDRQFYRLAGADPDRTITRQVNVIIPNYNEDSIAVFNTLKEAAMVNQWASDNGINFGVNSIILSDQSDPEKIKMNRGNLFTAKDYLKRLKKRGVDLPSIYHLVFDKEMDEIIGDFASEYYGHILKEKEPRGKGWNMLMSSLATGMYPDDEVALLYIDSENLLVGPDQIFAMGMPMYYMETGDNPEKYGGVKFVKTEFDRHHMEMGKKYPGGRVNSSVFRPLVCMLHEKGLLPDIGYPLTGEIGITRDSLWKIQVAKKYGVEMATLIQLLSRESPHAIDLRREFAEVFTGWNQDQAIGEGEEPEIALEKLGNMIKQIMPVTNELIGEEFYKERWESPDDFINDFRKYQEENARVWSRGHVRDDSDEVTGGIPINDLLDVSLEHVRNSMNELYGISPSDNRYDDELLAQLHSVRTGIGYRKFNNLIRAMGDKKYTIKD